MSIYPKSSDHKINALCTIGRGMFLVPLIMAHLSLLCMEGFQQILEHLDISSLQKLSTVSKAIYGLVQARAKKVVANLYIAIEPKLFERTVRAQTEIYHETVLCFRSFTSFEEMGPIMKFSAPKSSPTTITIGI